jgi:hypothetical protein
MLIDLTRAEISLLELMARQRYQPKLAAGFGASKADDKSSFHEVNVRGVVGEYAVAKYLDLPLNTESYGLWGDSGHDLIYRGKTLQVKFNTHFDGDLYFPKADKFISDYGVLVVREALYRVRIAGYIDRESFMLHKQVKNYGKNDVWAVEQRHLMPIEALKSE